MVMRSGKIELSKGDQVIVQGSLWKDLYCLNINIPTQHNTSTNNIHSLLSCIEPLPLVQRLSSSPMAAALQLMNSAGDKVDFYTA